MIRNKMSRSLFFRCSITTAILVVFYLYENTSFLKIGSSGLETYIIRPLLWSGLAWLVWQLPRSRAAGPLRLRSFLYFLALICGLIYLLSMFLGGVLDGFGKSPSSFTLLGILANLAFVGSLLAGTELSRAYLINSLGRKDSIFIMFLISTFFTFLSLQLQAILGLNSQVQYLNYLGTTVLPALAENTLTTYLAFLGGPFAALIYQGVLKGFTWFCPVLPNLSWMTKTLVGTLGPFLSLLLVQYLYQREAKEISKVTLKKENPAYWILTSVASVLIIWFVVGLFPFYPSVIVTGSMEPLIRPGDVVLIKKITGAEVQQGDVIHFRLDKITVTHRVIAINDTEKERQFLTKGDNNDTADIKPVASPQVKGKVVRVIPKLGWLTLLVHSRG